MKKFFKVLIIIIIFTFTVILLKKYHIKNYKIDIREDNINVNMQYKGIKHATDFTLDNKKNFYIAYKNKIQLIDRQGKSFDILKNKNLNINSIEFYNGNLYFSSDSSVYNYDLHNKRLTEIIKNIPNFGDYNKSLIKINKDFLYVTIGAATNSGVVGEDNNWIKNYPFGHDISPYKITLKGNNYSGNTGGFLNYGTKSIQGQIVPGHFPGNASIIYYNLKNGKLKNFAWGIRNIKGMDFDSKGKIIVSIGGIENRGARPIKGDKDYIYRINKNNWYGWPDYSGGDPLNSPKFKDNHNKRVEFILDNHPTTNPSAPIYMHKSLGTLGSLFIDKSGIIEEKDSICFFDNKEKKLYSLNKKGILKEKIKFYDECNITSIKNIYNNIYLLDSSSGNIYNVRYTNDSTENISNKSIMIFISIIIVIMILGVLKIVVFKLTKEKK
ncbi:conserved hypothetical protein [Clostridium botulinum C str. Eklund]|nr:conserved hypothetical protein [Clostridium botulinum C str. Eklund]NEZ50175.1 hypothetical protein [Clostridium botulinum]